MATPNLQANPAESNHDAVVNGFLRALDMVAETRKDTALDSVFPHAALDGMKSTACHEGISTKAHAALAVAVSMDKLLLALKSCEDCEGRLHRDQAASLDDVWIALKNLWDFLNPPPELAPVARYFDLRMPHPSLA